jgi:hypothetical protein
MPDKAGQALLAVDHQRNQYVTVHPELVEGFNQHFPNGGFTSMLIVNFI